MSGDGRRELGVRLGGRYVLAWVLPDDDRLFVDVGDRAQVILDVVDGELSVRLWDLDDDSGEPVGDLRLALGPGR